MSYEEHYRTLCPSSLSKVIPLIAVIACPVALTVYFQTHVCVERMVRMLLLFLTISAYGTGSHADPNPMDSGLKLTKPDDTIIVHKIGHIFPSINNGHLRFSIDINMLRNLSTTICQYAEAVPQMANWIRPENLAKLSARTQQSYKTLNASNEYPSQAFQLVVEKHLVNL